MAEKTNEYSDIWQFLSTTELKDITSSDSDLVRMINEVKGLQANGDYTSAAQKISDYNLQAYIMCSAYINAIDEKTRNVEIDCKDAGQSIYFDENEPTGIREGEVWIGDVWVENYDL